MITARVQATHLGEEVMNTSAAMRRDAALDHIQQRAFVWSDRRRHPTRHAGVPFDLERCSISYGASTECEGELREVAGKSFRLGEKPAGGRILR